MTFFLRAHCVFFFCVLLIYVDITLFAYLFYLLYRTITAEAEAAVLAFFLFPTYEMDNTFIDGESQVKYPSVPNDPRVMTLQKK